MVSKCAASKCAASKRAGVKVSWRQSDSGVKVSCSAWAYPFFCEVPIRSALSSTAAPLPDNQKCEPGWTYKRLANACWKVFPDQATWTDALLTCSAHDADIISIHSEEENGEVAEFLVSSALETDIVWLGLYWLCSWTGAETNCYNGTGYWSWSDNQAGRDYTNWAPLGMDNCTHNRTCAAAMLIPNDANFMQWLSYDGTAMGPQPVLCSSMLPK
ncbi:aggrecan core protein-like protein [Aphelenchoides avenae]|nr:aggrecan core protein-like protein [Aphelenchus avenae]